MSVRAAIYYQTALLLLIALQLGLVFGKELGCFLGQLDSSVSTPYSLPYLMRTSARLREKRRRNGIKKFSCLPSSDGL